MEKNKSKMACQVDGRMGGSGAFCRVKGSREDLKNEIMRDVKGDIILFPLFERCAGRLPSSYCLLLAGLCFFECDLM